MAKKFAIMRGVKLKTFNMNASVLHITRKQETPNADPKRAHLNYSAIGPSWDDKQGIHDAIKSRTPAKFRKDAIRALEYIVTASPEWFDENSDAQAALYFEAAVDWFQDEYGAENVVSAVVHHDETTPHMHIIVVPVDSVTGRLNAKQIFGGKGVLHHRQSAFAEHMQSFGVERGQPNPERRHTTSRSWRAGHASLDEREAALKAREAEVAADAQRAANDLESAQAVYESARKALSEAECKENQINDRTEQLDGREEAIRQREVQLAALEREITSRGEHLAGGEKALEKRQSEIDRAGQVLQQRLDAARAAKAEFDQQKAAWLESNKPQVPAIVEQLRQLETMGVIESADYLEEMKSDELEACFDPLSGLTKHGQALMDKYSDTEEQREKFDQMFTPGSTPGL